MILLSKIKDIAIGGMALLAGLFYLLMNRSNRKAKQAKKERDIAQTQADFSDKRVKLHEDKKDIEQDIAMGDMPHIDERLSKYTRD